jgi:hypothetical protein
MCMKKKGTARWQGGMAGFIRPAGIGKRAPRPLLMRVIGSHLKTVTNELGDQATPEKPNQPLLLNDLLHFHHPALSDYQYC